MSGTAFTLHVCAYMFAVNHFIHTYTHLNEFLIGHLVFDIF